MNVQAIGAVVIGDTCLGGLHSVAITYTNGRAIRCCLTHIDIYPLISAVARERIDNPFGDKHFMRPGPSYLDSRGLTSLPAVEEVLRKAEAWRALDDVDSDDERVFVGPVMHTPHERPDIQQLDLSSHAPPNYEAELNPRDF